MIKCRDSRQLSAISPRSIPGQVDGGGSRRDINRGGEKSSTNCIAIEKLNYDAYSSQKSGPILSYRSLARAARGQMALLLLRTQKGNNEMSREIQLLSTREWNSCRGKGRKRLFKSRVSVTGSLRETNGAGLATSSFLTPSPNSVSLIDDLRNERFFSRNYSPLNHPLFLFLVDESPKLQHCIVFLKWDFFGHGYVGNSFPRKLWRKDCHRNCCPYAHFRGVKNISSVWSSSARFVGWNTV